MKIVKKLSIGFLAIVVCFCSCFKFINAEILNEPFSLLNGETYLLVIDSSSTINEEKLIAFSDNIDIVYHPNSIDFVASGPSGTTTTTSSPLTLIKEENNFTYYSFIYLGNDASFNYEEIEIAYFETFEDNSNGFSVYDTIYNLIETYIFGGNIEIGSHQDLTATTLSSIICVLVFALPFLIIWKVLKLIMG